MASVRYDLVNEQVLIVAACADPQARARLVRRIPDPAAFYDPKHPDIWRGLVELDRRGLEFSGPALRQVTGGAADADYVERLLGSYKRVPPNLNLHVDALAWDKVRVEAAEGPVPALIKLLQDPSSSPDALRAASRALARHFESHGGELRYLHDPNELVRSQIATIRARSGGHAVYPFGVDGLDIDTAENRWRMIPGAAPGMVTVVTGRTGSGKSALVARMVLGLVAQERRVLYGAWEVGSGMTLEVLAAMSLGYSREALMTGGLTEEEMQAVEQEMDRLAGWVRFMKQPFGRERGKAKVTNDQALDVIHRYLDDAGCDVAAFDMLKRAFRQTRPEEEEDALFRMQAIAEETGVHVIAAHQQLIKTGNKDGRFDPRPTQEGAKGSSAWAEIADNMIGVHRPAHWKKVDDVTIEVLILKQRYGKWPLAVEFDWSGEFGSFENGRGVPYDPPGADASSVDPIADFAPPKQGGRGRGRRD